MSRGRSNAEVKRLALAHVQELEEKIRHLREMSATLVTTQAGSSAAEA